MYVLKNPLEAVDVLIGVNVLRLFQEPSSGLGDFGKRLIPGCLTSLYWLQQVL